FSASSLCHSICVIPLLTSSSTPPHPPRSTLFPYTTLFRSIIRPVILHKTNKADATTEETDEPIETVETAVGFKSVKCIFALSDTDRKSTRLNSSHGSISYAVFCLKKKIATPRPGSQ